LPKRRQPNLQGYKATRLDQPKVSALVRGRLAGFSTDRLLRCLMLLGQDVDIVVREKTNEYFKAHINVIASTPK
jgi:hypothetical protein